MASASPPHAATPTGPEAPPSTDKGNDKHSIILQGGLGTRLTHLSRHSGHCFVNPPVQRGSTVLFPTVKERNASWFERKRFEQALTYGINGSEVCFKTGNYRIDSICRALLSMSTVLRASFASPPAGPSPPSHPIQTHHMLEDMVANIEGGTRSQITSSGLSACTIALLAYTKAGDHVLLPDSIYGPVRGFAEGMLRRFHVDVEYYHASATGTDVAALLKENTTVVYIESPGSHTFEVVDVKAIASVARNHGAKSILDNTYGIHFFRPFEKGNVDISVQVCSTLEKGKRVAVLLGKESFRQYIVITPLIPPQSLFLLPSLPPFLLLPTKALTKYVVGHSDALLGAITVNTRENWEQVRQCVLELGEAVSPDDCWLAIRGARTLGVRLKYQMEAGLEVARWVGREKWRREG